MESAPEMLYFGSFNDIHPDDSEKSFCRRHREREPERRRVGSESPTPRDPDLLIPERMRERHTQSEPELPMQKDSTS